MHDALRFGKEAQGPVSGADSGDPKGTEPVYEGNEEGRGHRGRDRRGSGETARERRSGKMSRSGAQEPRLPIQAVLPGILTGPPSSSPGLSNSSGSPGQPWAGTSPAGPFSTGPAQSQKALSLDSSEWAGQGLVPLALGGRELRDTGPVWPPHSLPVHTFTFIRDAPDETGN